MTKNKQGIQTREEGPGLSWAREGKGEKETCRKGEALERGAEAAEPPVWGRALKPSLASERGTGLLLAPLLSWGPKAEL